MKRILFSAVPVKSTGHTGIREKPAAASEGRLFAYAVIFFLLTKTFWLVWERCDLSGGDSVEYYGMARFWHDRFATTFVWSPLYTAFYGSFLWLNADPFFATPVHRICIMVISSLLFYEVMRRLVPQVFAILAVAWWIVLPINFNCAYEVHLFSIIPSLVGVLILATGDTPWHRGAATGVFVLSTLLVRYEMFVATLLFGVLALGYDILCAARGYRLASKGMTLLKAYGYPLLIVFLLTLFFMLRSGKSLKDMAGSFHHKQAHNMNQMYSYNYHQRHPEWTLDPWLQYHSLMLQQFGSDNLTFAQAFRANPQAIMEHLLWNLRLAPDGLALALFNARAGPVNPDYLASEREPLKVAILGSVYLLIVAVGLVGILRNWPFWKSYFMSKRIWPYVGLACVAATGIVVLFMQRPRPSYMFGLTVALMVLVTLCAYVIVHDWKISVRLDWLTWVVAILLVLFFPAYWASQPRSQPILSQVEALRPFRGKIISGKLAPLATSGYEDDISAYLNLGKASKSGFQSIRALQDELAEGQSLSSLLVQRGFKLVLINGFVGSDPPIQEFEQTAEENGWKIARTRSDSDSYHSYKVYVRKAKN
jgi:hypothetical protein